MNTTTHRLFFALWPDKKIRADIKGYIQPFVSKHPAKKVPQHNWHITLAFLGNVSAEIKQCVIERAALLKSQPFQLRLDTFGFFKRAQVVWLGCQQCPDVLTLFVEQLNTQLASCGYEPDFKAFTPHMTLLRKAYKKLDVTEVKPVNWSVKEFTLVESVTTDQGAVYNVIKRWPLTS